MKILSMTATFGKLEHQTLTLQPGLNILEAPNEWGKSTWCAFILDMFYGIDTKERTKTGVLADKERYAPWSGSPMAGSMRLLWQGRDITIQRSSKGRSIFGVFRAFETDTGVDIPELTADNCGQVLLGVEKAVFIRSGFLKLSDLPVTEDPALWRRLNALVTTGDESGASDTLAQKLRDLKNRCRANRANGLIPQVQAQKADLESKLTQLQDLKTQIQTIKTRQAQVEEHYSALCNHQAALEYAAAAENARHIQQARQAQQDAEAQLADWEIRCSTLPDAQTAKRSFQELKQLQEQSLALQMEQQMLPQPPALPQEEPPFAGLRVSQAEEMVAKDTAAYTAAGQQKLYKLLTLAGILLLPISVAIFIFVLMWAGLLGAIAGVVLLVLGTSRLKGQKKLRRSLEEKYSSGDPDQWKQQLEAFCSRQRACSERSQQYEASHREFSARQAQLSQTLRELTADAGLQASLDHWQDVLSAHEALEDARREARRAASHAQALAAMVKPVDKPQMPDTMTYSAPETARLLSDCGYERSSLQRRLGHCQGQMDALGEEALLHQQLEAVSQRLARLEQTYAALELAQQMVQEASAQLQRRFAPRIAHRAQELFGKLTDQRYDQLTLGADMRLSVSAQQEDVLRSSLWRSDGTVDQLYLALRLAVAEELTPEVPLILDDALVRFDDTRLKAALQLLQEAAQHKQVLLFTCQSRERALLNQH